MSDYEYFRGCSWIKEKVYQTNMREKNSEFRALKANHSSEIKKLESEMKGTLRYLKVPFILDSNFLFMYYSSMANGIIFI